MDHKKQFKLHNYEYYVILIDESVKAQDFLTYKYFKEKPEEVWDWHYEFKRMVRLSSPNVCHTVVSEIQQFCEENDIECTLITQVFIIPSK